MGYTTRFEGRFSLDRLPPAEAIVQLRALEDAEDLEDSPGGYCQWRLTKDCRHIEWDGGEKFAAYVEWLQWIIDRILTPAGVSLSGTAEYAGEDIRDRGTISVHGGEGRARKAEAPAVADDLDTLRRFREFVLAYDYADAILAGWDRAEKRRKAMTRQP